MLVCLSERPMHAYEVGQTLRERRKHESVRLNYGSLYGVVRSLAGRGLIEPQGTDRAGRLPERTTYALTTAGRAEMRAWLGELLAEPARDYTRFEAALSFIPVLAPAEVRALLRARLEALAAAGATGSRGLLGSAEVPRIFWVEEEYRAALRSAEAAYVQALLDDMDAGRLDGQDWWAGIHAAG